MSKTTKRWLGIALATVLIVALGIAGFVMASTPGEEPVCYRHGDVNGDGTVNKDDAIYLLYASFPGLSAEFPLQNDGEIDGVGSIDKDDAIYLLYASFPDEAVRNEFPLKGKIHSYYDPTWTWNEAAGTAKVTFKCGCGSDDHPDGGVVEATVSSSVVEAPTCVKTGTTKLTATVTYNGTEYTDTKTVVTPANDHDLSEKSCTVDQECANCDYKITASGHSFALLSTTPASCTAAGEEKYKCSNCPETKTVALEQLHHQLTYVENGDVADDAVKCRFIKQYTCSVCSGVFDGTGADDVYTKHTYVTTLTKEANCSEDGVKTTACSVCGDVKGTETVAQDASKHAWDKGAESAGKITFTCGVCSTTRTEVVASQDGAVDTSDLDADTGVNLGNASVALDQNALKNLTDKNISNNIIIKVEEKDKTTVGLDAEQAEQIRGNTVYDFTMTYDDVNKTPVTDFGSGLVTVTLPYKLETGEDINSIDIWYIDGNGNPQQVAGAVYSNGFVTFQTSHFSYYTVTRLTPAERCARLGSHIEISQSKAATCTEDGYDMTICQRCATVTSYIPKAKLVHKYTENEQPATCDKEGKLTQTCTNGSCGHTVTKTIPALGHKMTLDIEKTVAATCSAAGKTVEFCERGCGYTTEETTAQLSHVYELSAEKSLAATCTAAGYEIHVCSLCKDEVKKNETAPLGHNYTDALVQWAWTEENTATATLVCENDSNHTKVLEAVVTKNTEKSQNTSCLGSGSTVYDAAVGYNNKTYTDFKEITVAAPGHKPSVAWYTSESQHYHLCTVCDAKLDATAHAWNEGTVTLAPTCKDAGSKTVACTVCAYSKTQELPATGEHTYVNGKCSVCGFAENSCRHLPINKSVIDSASHGLCAGTVLYKYSCDCGEVVEYEEVSNNCSFGEETAETVTDEYGFKSTIYTAVCEGCGLVAKGGYLQLIDAENCHREVVNSAEYSMDGKVIAAVQHVAYDSYHPAVTVTETVTLEEEGLCGTITLTFKKCICGKYVTSTISGACQWGWAVGGGMNETNSHGMCINCGATQDIEWVYTTAQDDPCMRVRTNTITFGFGDKELITYKESYESENHSIELTGYELVGKTCDDGVVVNATCTTCGEKYEDFYRGHEPVVEERVDISEYNLCSKYLIKTSCVCPEKYSDNRLENTDGTGCDFYPGWDKATGKEYQYCYECGVRMFEDITYGEKGEDCLCTTDTVTKYVNSEGQVLFTATGHGQTNHHNMKEEGKLVEGATSCEDGIAVRMYCTDCSYEYTYENNWHESFPVAVYDLSAFDSCTKSITLYRCPCGQETYADFDGSCNSQWVEDGVDSQEQYKCTVCGLVETINYSYPETDDKCMVRVVKVYTFSKEGVEGTVRFTTEEENWSHDYVFQLTLKEDAKSCTEGGFTGTGTCRHCGDVTTTQGFWHNGYKIRHEAVDNGKMCGKVEIIQYSCACGESGGTNIYWDEANRCHFSESEYMEDQDCWKYICPTCGSYYYSVTSSAPVEGSTCQIRYDHAYKYFDRDDNLLFESVTQGYGATHDYAVSFQDAQGNVFAGESCSEGFYLVNTCTKCGESFKSDELHTQCETYASEKVVLLDGTDLCGEVVLIKGKCPCGARTSAHVESDCVFYHYGYDEQDRQLMKCPNCNLMRAYDRKEIKRDGECAADVNIICDFYRNDELVAQVDEDYVTEAHRWVHTFTNKPASCEEGWGYTYSCFDCGEYGGMSIDNYYHSRCSTGYYDLSKYGMCKGYIETDSCACGENVGWDFVEEKCVWKHVSTKDGVATYFCENCNTYCKRTEAGERDENCVYRGTERLQFIRNDEIVLDVTVNEAYVSHKTSRSSMTLVTPGTSCLAGVRVVWDCDSCDYTTTNIERYHYPQETDKIESACGTVITRQECLCGEVSNVYTSEQCNFSVLETKSTGDEFNGTEVYHRECMDCGLNIRRQSSWGKPETSCDQVREGTYTIQYNGETWGLEYQNTEVRHTYGDTVYTLATGATTCVGNLTATRTCKICDYSYSGNAGDDHYMNKVATLDLKDYGAACGGELVKYACPCGAIGRLSLSEDASCELQKQGTDLWITDVLDEVSNVSVDGTDWYYSDAYTFTCAVTEPKCSLQLRMEEYWQVKGCIAYEYQCWQYKNAETGEWVDIAKVATGNRRGYHAYTQTAVDTTENAAKVTGTKYDCACGDYYYTLRYEYADGTYKTTVDAVDTTGAEYYSEVHHVNEFMKVWNSKVFITRNYYEYHYTDNSENYWENRVYTYNLDGTCEVTTTLTNSNGSTNEFKSKHIDGSEDTILLKENTCTQPGQRRWERYCAACNEVVRYTIYDVDPLNHCWYETQEGYACSTCGLESENGASEGIIIEDFTEKYGNGTQYVAGYWNKTDAQFVNNVSVIIDGQEPQVLAGIECTEHETLTAICFDKALADQLAAEAADGAAYELRLNFVITEGETKEYAITFTNDAAQ